MLERSGLKLTALIFFSVASFSAADPGASAVSAIFNTICSAQGNPQGNRSAKFTTREATPIYRSTANKTRSEV